jgi:prepilin-type N-terminal cleavage/methylation domain-containing protein
MTPISKKTERPHGWDKGFTLVEVMIAMLIFIIVTVALTRLSVGTSQGNTIARHSTESSVIGAGFLESVISRAYRGADMTDGPYSFVQDGCTVNYTISTAAILPDTKHIEMVVSYPMGNTTKTLRYHYLVPERK